MPKYSRNLTEWSTPFSNACLKFMVIFHKIVIVFLGRNTPNNKFLNVTSKETNKVMWHYCWNPSIINMEQLIFTWKGRQLLLVLFASIILSYVKGHLKNSSLNFMSSVGLQASKIWMFFWKIYCRTSFEIIFMQK